MTFFTARHPLLLATALVLGLGGLAGCGAASRTASAINPFDGGRDAATEAADGETDRISILSFDRRLEVDAALAAQRIDLPTAYVNSAWPNEGGYATHAVQHPQLADGARVAWRRSVGEGSSRSGRIAAPPVKGDGRVYVLDAATTVSAYSADGGDRVWRATLRSDSRRDREARGGGVAFDDGRLFVTSGFGYVAALDAATGEEIWRRDTPAPMHAPATVADGRVFAVSFDNELIAIDAKSGAILWTYQSLSEPARILTASSPAVSGDVVVAPFASGELVALRVQNGRPIWTEALTRAGASTALAELNDIAGSPVIVGDVVYAVSHSGILAAIDLRTGERVWNQPAGAIHMPWLIGDYLYIVTNEAQVAALSRTNGAVHWLHELPRYENPEGRKGRIAWAGPIVAGGRVIVVSSRGEFVELDPQTGSRLRTERLGDSLFIPPIIAQETLYLMSDEGRLIAMR